MKIQICGPGCANCTKAEKIVSEAVAEVGADAQIEKVTDFQEMARLGVLSTPAVVIDGKIKCVGRVPSKDQVKSWLQG
ncbi:MAG: TM0996/MTH895 family glutaredoxin-like protein [Proteobacteria bacterium]|nr:TM0996/MTH895 family glutaredoxin-like protein [Pseudomonadota bacterium]MBU1714717.1 TM0996/MTH895 family glutaredoxin-like protein [Pseudomonadota bacterium]